MSTILKSLRRRTAVPMSIAASALVALALTAPPAAAQVSDDGCPYGYYYSDTDCLPYSWSGSDYGFPYLGGAAHRGFRHGFSGGGFHGGGFQGGGFHGGGFGGGHR